MLETEKLITGDWIEIREASKDLYSLIAYFKPSAEIINKQIELIRNSVEGGIVEYKRSSLMPVFIALENMKYQSLNAEEMYIQEINSKALLYVIVLQRMLCQGTVPLSADRTKKTRAIFDVDINTIVTDIKERLNRDPSIKNHPSVKKILMQVNLYRKEHNKLKELFNQIKTDKMASYLSNFVLSFDTIFSSIRKNYSDLLTEEETKVRKGQEIRILASLPLKKLTEIYTRQAREVSRIRSVLGYARSEKYKTREILVRLYQDKENILKTIDAEETSYKNLCRHENNLSPDDCFKRTELEFKKELLILLARTIRDIS
ncbi:MAG: hypothetical protein GXP33_03315 [Spirochaetes bacterium]|nr:hypothetical protein [Spirochaetota bacterium]